MAKGDDTVRKKKNKVLRKKINRKNDSSTVSARVASIIASKKRRKAGKRRMCQGMCFSLPTLDDPFNDKLDHKDTGKKETEKTVPSKLNRKALAKRKENDTLMEDQPDRKKARCVRGNQEEAPDSSSYPPSIYPSKYLTDCLETLDNAFYPDDTYNSDGEKCPHVNLLGYPFWRTYSQGTDVLVTNESSPDFDLIAWIASTAADVISKREKAGHLYAGPFLLFIAPSKEQALKARSIFKPLKAQGIHTVSLHSGASVEHQINGLQSCEPEFLVSTPGRLLKLVSLKAIDISRVSMLVIDALESTSGGCYLDTVSLIKQAISGKHHTTVFFNPFSNAGSVPAVQNLLNGSILRFPLEGSLASRSAFIIQSIHVCSSKEEKIKKGIRALDNVYCNQLVQPPLKVLYIVGKDKNVKRLVSAAEAKGYSISTDSNLNITDSEKSLDRGSKTRPVVSIIDTEHISSTDLREYGVVIIPDFVLSIEDYVHIVTNMARYTVDGVVHSFLTKDDARHAGPLIEILEQCAQPVPEDLRNL